MASVYRQDPCSELFYCMFVGHLKHITKLKPWALYEVLREKYEWSHQKALAFQDFLMPMLQFEPSKRATAADCIKHKWLTSDEMPSPSIDQPEPEDEQEVLVASDNDDADDADDDEIVADDES